MESVRLTTEKSQQEVAVSAMAVDGQPCSAHDQVRDIRRKRKDTGIVNVADQLIVITGRPHDNFGHIYETPFDNLTGRSFAAYNRSSPF